jgi:hypothetical protein
VRHETAHNFYEHESENDNEGPADAPLVPNCGAVAMVMPMLTAVMALARLVRAVQLLVIAIGHIRNLVPVWSPQNEFEIDLHTNGKVKQTTNLPNPW